MSDFEDFEDIWGKSWHLGNQLPHCLSIKTFDDFTGKEMEKISLIFR